MEILSAFLTPVIALIALYIAWMQHKTARNKLNLELYEKRYALYLAAKEFITKIAVSDPEVFSVAYNEFDIKTNSTKFLFKEDVSKYIDTLKTPLSLSAIVILHAAFSIVSIFGFRNIKTGYGKNK